MAVQAGWVGTSAKAETGKSSMGEARLELRLPRAGWMSEMIGKSTEVLFINTVNRAQASIYELMGSPTVPNVYVFENTATISAATQGGWALQTGTFPAGSTLKIINRGYIRGGGGSSTVTAGQKGGDAILLNFPTQIDNSEGYIYAGGGGGGSIYYTASSTLLSGGGGAGTPAGGVAPTSAQIKASSGTATTGGNGASAGSLYSGRGGDLGKAGAGSSEGRAGGAAGRAVVLSGNALTWLGGNDTTRVIGAVV